MILEKKAKYKFSKIELLDKDSDIPQIAPQMIDDYLKLTNLYKVALREVSANLEFIDDEFQLLNDHNPIHHMECRMKSVESVVEKAKRRKIKLTIDSIRENITDIAGIRVICNYIEDVYKLTELILNKKDIPIIKKTDYIKNPKENGYRSLHLVIKMPVNTASELQYVPVEIQLRTIAMDMWASLEHEMLYKSNKTAADIDRMKLKICADELSNIDGYMQGIYKSL